jgi:hypothetical protein
VPLIKDNACLNEPYFRPTTITLEDLGAAGKTVLHLSWPRCLCMWSSGSIHIYREKCAVFILSTVRRLLLSKPFACFVCISGNACTGL